MGRDFAAAVPAAMGGFRRGSAATGLDLERLCFHADAEELVDTAVQHTALVATSLAVPAAPRPARGGGDSGRGGWPRRGGGPAWRRISSSATRSGNSPRWRPPRR